MHPCPEGSAVQGGREAQEEALAAPEDGVGLAGEGRPRRLRPGGSAWAGPTAGGVWGALGALCRLSGQPRLLRRLWPFCCNRAAALEMAAAFA